MIRKKKAEVMASMKILIPPILTITLLMVLIPGIGNAQSVEQMDYRFRMEITQDVSIKTFVMGEFDRVHYLRPPAEFPFAEKNKGKLTVRMGQSQTVNHGLIEPILFDLASFKVTEQIKDEILLHLQDKADKRTPLQVIGFTCELGSQAANDKLAQQRAVVVAELLRDNSYLVSSVEGKGRQGYITDIPQLRHLNRRVEIKLDKPHNQEM